ncbi:hypothetical protein L0152_27780, partial [bacterium]|nr:hypothetical protein [bacterium]
DLNDTECPGDSLATLVPTIRTMVARADFTTPILPKVAVAKKKQPGEANTLLMKEGIKGRLETF